MNIAKCFEIASIVLNEATNRFSDAYVEDEEKKNEFKCFCEILDDVILRFDEVYVGRGFQGNRRHSHLRAI